ncbi:hypothetical protein J8N05_45555 [Streptomyces sp. BH-SS-21]|uniref:Uncharacterized protein n=1 Tax=Streptomyces liliiviolaceus TaxID=2823109 RepID=A0A940Y170_9ACTN|nr:hypothetical protein [Streptomyces liliiviolaceus]MBQ0855439.1 hypothetical protein [Streptomyces liliiviolaceus]
MSALNPVRAAIPTPRMTLASLAADGGRDMHLVAASADECSITPIVDSGEAVWVTLVNNEAQSAHDALTLSLIF